MAAPHVSGLAALIVAKHPEFTNEEVRQVLRSSADDVDPPGFDIYSGYGRINAARALSGHSEKPNPSWQVAPAISGDRVVWQDWRSGNPDIQLYDPWENDTDGDGFADGDEKLIGTDPEDACPEPDVDPDPAAEYHVRAHPYTPGDNASPLDVDNNEFVTVTDVVQVVDRFMSTTEPRYDVDAESVVTVTDIVKMVDAFLESCQN